MLLVGCQSSTENMLMCVNVSLLPDLLFPEASGGHSPHLQGPFSICS